MPRMPGFTLVYPLCVKKPKALRLQLEEVLVRNPPYLDPKEPSLLGLLILNIFTRNVSSYAMP